MRDAFSTVQYSTVQYGTVQHSTVQYCTVQCSTVQYSKHACYISYRLQATGYLLGNEEEEEVEVTGTDAGSLLRW